MSDLYSRIIQAREDAIKEGRLQAPTVLRVSEDCYNELMSLPEACNTIGFTARTNRTTVFGMVLEVVSDLPVEFELR